MSQSHHESRQRTQAIFAHRKYTNALARRLQVLTLSISARTPARSSNREVAYSNCLPESCKICPSKPPIHPVRPKTRKTCWYQDAGLAQVILLPDTAYVSAGILIDKSNSTIEEDAKRSGIVAGPVGPSKRDELAGTVPVLYWTHSCGPCQIRLVD